MNTTTPPRTRRTPWHPDGRIQWVTSIPFGIAHLIPLLAFFTGVDRRAVVIMVAFFWVRMFFITAGYHRYFSHRSYHMGRVTQAVMAFGGTTSVQKGPLWWSATHRLHHRYSDTERDPHSPIHGFWWSHVGWILAEASKDPDLSEVSEFAEYPEIRFIDRHDWVGPWFAGVLAFLLGGWSGLVVGFFGSTVLLWHSTFLVNSAAHVFGRRRFETADTSRNSLLIALLTGGEGWHNNHHHYAPSARQGFYWWEIDTTYYVLRVLRLLGVVRKLRKPSPKVLATKRVDGKAGLRDQERVAA